MYAIATVNELEFFERSKAVISVLLAESYDRSLLQWVAASWNELHSDSGMNWHVIIPSRTGVAAHTIAEGIYDRGAQYLSNNYNTELSRELLDFYGISRDKSPVLVFDDFNEEKHQRYIPISGRSEEELKKIFKTTAKLISKNTNNPQTDIDRSTLTDRAVDHISMQIAAKTAQKAVSIISSAGRLFG